MINVILAVLGLFPVSFLAFVCSERLNVTHQARVGRAITFGDFLKQHWVDMTADLRSIPSFRAALLYTSQLSVVCLLFLDIDSAFYIYLLLNWFFIVISTHDELDVFERVGSDRSQMRFLLGGFVAFVCILGCGLTQGVTNISAWHWDWTHLLFLLPFQIAGMVMFGEHPFEPIYPRVFWLKSSRFFVWSLVSTEIFLGGSWFMLDFYLKALAIYLASRLAGQYFPKYAQDDLFRIGILYLIPVTFFVFLVSAVIHV